MDLGTLGRTILVIAVTLLLIGLLMIGLGKLGLGRLPGDIVYRRDGVTIYFPIVTMILVSILLRNCFERLCPVWLALSAAGIVVGPAMYGFIHSRPSASPATNISAPSAATDVQHSF